MHGRVETGGEEGSFFEGDIRLAPTDDPYNNRRKLFKVKRMTEGKTTTVSPSSGDGELEPLGEHTWPDRIIPFMFPPTLCKSQSVTAVHVHALR